MRVRYDKNADKTLEENEIYIQEPLQNIGKWQQEFENENPLHLEIGMGKGNFIINMAKQFPDINFIGMERNKTILAKAVKKIEKEGITNIRVMSSDAQQLKEIFASKELDKIYLNFSDPWPKNKHYKRRLTYKDFLDYLTLHPYASIVEIVSVVSSRTSRRASTVSRDVNIVTLYSVAT